MILKALPYLIIIITVGAYTWWIEHVGYERGRAELTEYIAEQSLKSEQTRKVVENVIRQETIRYVDRVKEVRVKGDTIVKEVTVYVTKTDDAACELRAGFVRAHDAAVEGEPAGPGLETDRTPAGITLAEATSVIADNYKTCRLYKERAEALIRAYLKVQATFGAAE